MTDRQSVIDALTKPFPREAIKELNGRPYVSGTTVIYRLNEATNYDWEFEITDHELVGGADTQGNKPAHVVYGRMRIPIISPGWRADVGTQALENSKDDHEAYKGAATDCLKRCARQFGVGLHLWGPDIEAGEIGNRPAPQQRQQQAPVQQRQMAQPQSQTPRPTNGNGYGNGYPQQQASAQQVDRAQMMNPNDPATDKQRDFIVGLAKQLGMVSDNGHHDAAALDAEVRQLTGGETMGTITKAQAKLVIEEFKDRPKLVTR